MYQVTVTVLNVEIELCTVVINICEECRYCNRIPCQIIFYDLLEVMHIWSKELVSLYVCASVHPSHFR